MRLFPRLLLSLLPFSFVALPLVQAQAARSALKYCATPGVLDQSCIDRALNSGDPGPVQVPSGNYSGSSLTVNRSDIKLILAPGANLNFTLLLGGTGFDRSASVTVAGAVPAGTTVLNGNFSGYHAGDTVLIEQTKATHENQIGLEFALVSHASDGQLVLSGPLRLPYNAPTVSILPSAHIISQDLPRGAQSIAGHFEHDLHPGDLVRIENVRGNDSPMGRPFYFEIARVASVSRDAVFFETPLHSAFGTPWMVRMNAASNIDVEGNGGHIDTLLLASAHNVNIDHLATILFNARLLYGFNFANLRGHTNGPTAFNLIWCWHGNIANIDASGARSYTDNGNFKIMSLSDVAVRGVDSYDSIAYDQGTYPFMIDFDFVPYSMWNVNVNASGIRTRDTHWNKGTPYGVFLAGLRDSSIADVTTTDGITLRSNAGLSGSNLNADGLLQIRSGANYSLTDFRADVISIGDDSVVRDSHFDRFNVLGRATTYASRSLWIRSRSTGLVFTNGKFAPSANTTIYLNNGCEASFDQIEDSSSRDSIVNDGGTVSLGRTALKGTVKGAPTRRLAL